jgi:hypothetical protein
MLAGIAPRNKVGICDLALDIVTVKPDTDTPATVVDKFRVFQGRFKQRLSTDISAHRSTLTYAPLVGIACSTPAAMSGRRTSMSSLLAYSALLYGPRRGHGHERRSYRHGGQS